MAACYGDFRAGLAATVDWYRENEWWWKPHKEATEARYQVSAAESGGQAHPASGAG